jgi:hypothetical protein
LSVTAIWTAHCDGCSQWNDGTMADSKGQAIAGARKQGWLVTNDQTLCADCRARSVPPASAADGVAGADDEQGEAEQRQDHADDPQDVQVEDQAEDDQHDAEDDHAADVPRSVGR